MAKMFIIPYFAEFNHVSQLVHVGRFLANHRQRNRSDDTNLGPMLTWSTQVNTVQWVQDRTDENLDQLQPPLPEKSLIHEFAYNALMGDPAAIDAIKDILKQ